MAENQTTTKKKVTVEELEAKLDSIVNSCGGIKDKDIANRVEEVKELVRRKYRGDNEDD
jgi:hypothetical protein